MQRTTNRWFELTKKRGNRKTIDEPEQPANSKTIYGSNMNLNFVQHVPSAGTLDLLFSVKEQ